ncbi:hypothetical protein DSO57_1033800 [Entomophthora muscae]|uniref:Uncharacterized protein n=1 Tax=Entomophthora muscae TaxID=34485 RepID=A0ACC2S260_9FUNG|nr:hypothetical protein DSO57_1033800 [Entomophthora muscae]
MVSWLRKKFKLSTANQPISEPSSYEMKRGVIKGVYMAGYLPRQKKSSLLLLSSFFKPKKKTTRRMPSGIVELASQKIKISELPEGLWKYTLFLETLRMNLYSISDHLFVINNIDAPHLKALVLWDLDVGNHIVEAIAYNFPRLRDIKILYKLSKVSGIEAIPRIHSLRYASVAHMDSGTHTIPMAISYPQALSNLRMLDIGDLLFEWDSRLPVFPQVKELRLTVPHKQGFLSRHFPNIKGLSYSLESGSISTYECIAEFRKLKDLVLSDLPSNSIKKNHMIRSTTVTHLTLMSINSINRSFWLWLMAAFPNLVYLKIDSTSFTAATVPTAYANALPKLTTFICPAKLPLLFWYYFSRFAPKAKEPIVD